MNDYGQLTTALAAFAGYFSFATGVTKFFALDKPTTENAGQRTAKFMESVISGSSGILIVWAAIRYGHLPYMWYSLAIYSLLLIVSSIGLYRYQQWRLSNGLRHRGDAAG